MTNKNLVLVYVRVVGEVPCPNPDLSLVAAHACLRLFCMYDEYKVLSSHPKEDQKFVFKIDYCLMQVKSIAKYAPREHFAILSTCIKLPSVFKTFVLSIFEWLLKTGFTVILMLTWINMETFIISFHTVFT